MRIPHLILLSSIALALTVQAEEKAVVSLPTLAVEQHPEPAKDVLPLDDKSSSESKESMKPISVEKHVETTADGTTITTVKTVFSGKVDGTSMATKGLFSSVFDKILGLDFGQALFGVDDDDKKDVNETYDYMPLWGDEGYEPRALPEPTDDQPPCPKLGFLDQMVWDQQGDRGLQVPVVLSEDPSMKEKRPPVELPVEKPKIEGANPEEISKNAPKAGETKTEPPKPEGAKPDVMMPVPPTDGAVVPRPVAETTIGAEDDLKDMNAESTKELKADGISICLFGPCNSNDNDDDMSDRKHPRHRRHRIRHSQSTFLKMFKGMALLIDNKSKCPIPFHKK